MQKIVKGFYTLQKIQTEVKRFDVQSIFLVTGNKSYTDSGAENVLSRELNQLSVTRFSDFSPNPKIEDVKKGIRLISEHTHDMVIAVGGGSVIDMAKCVNLLSSQTNQEKIEEYATGREKLVQKGRPLIAIPTTSGSGSEATHFAVLYINGKKFSLAHKTMRPDIVILDPTLTAALPKKTAASAGIDAFCQSVESFWSVNSTFKSRKYSMKAMKLIIDNLEKSINKPTKRHRKAMSEAAYYAGKAINIAKTTAPHALSYYFTKKYNIAHGHAVALNLPGFIIFNSSVTEDDVNDKRGVRFVHRRLKTLLGLLGVSTPYEAAERVKDLINSIGLESTYAGLKIDIDDELHELQMNINLERLKNNPRSVNFNDVASILGTDD